MASKVLENLRGKKIAILGFGREGESLLKFLSKAGIKEVTVLDADERLEKKEIAERLGAQLVLGKHYLKKIGDFDIIFRSPGVPLDLPDLGAVRSRLSSATKLFFELAPTRNIVGVTGTKGKSTAASLIEKILSRKFRRVFLAGNIGSPMLDLLPRLKKGDWVVLELSSFQLEDLTNSPYIAVLLNVTPEHLYRHGSFQRYLFSKSTIFRYQKNRDFLVTNFDHFVLRSIAEEARSKVIFISSQKELTGGVFVERGKVISTIKGKRIILDLSEIPLLGRHNLENILPAVAVGLLAHVSPQRIQLAIKQFRGLPHRLEKVGERSGVLFIDDSIATTPEASLAGVGSFALPVALIAGGSSKGAEFTAWARGIARNSVVYVALIGEESLKMEKALKKYAPAVKREKFSTLLQAVKGAFKAVRERRGVVLLSPGCASFGMFLDFADRGKQFQEAIKRLS